MEEPATYLKRLHVDAKDLEAQCIPLDESLWHVNRYEDFLEVRRKLLALKSKRVSGHLSASKYMGRMASLEGESHRAMVSIYEVAKDHDYFATHFKRMLDEYGGAQTATRLLARREIQAGLMKL